MDPNASVQSPTPVMPDSTPVLVTSQKKSLSKKGGIIVCIFIVALVGMGIAFQLFIIAPQKKILKANIDQQAQNLQSLSNLNKQMIQLIKENIVNEQEGKKINDETKSIFISSIRNSPLLAPAASSSSNTVKGEQTVDPTGQLQKEIAFDKKGIQLTTEIIAVNNTIDVLYKANLFKYFIPDPQSLSTKTAEMATKLKNLFTYEEKINLINLDQENISLPFTLAFAALMSSTRPESDAYIAQLKDLMGKTEANEKKVEALDNSSIPPKVRDFQKGSINDFQQQKLLLTHLFTNYANNDKVSLKKNFIAIVSQPSPEGSTSFLSFWQSDESLSSIVTVNKEWNDLSKK